MKTETELKRILEDVVGAKNLSSNARFLDIGGNSLNLVQVLKRIEDKFGVSPSPRIFFDKSRSTVAGISAALDSQLQERLSSPPQNGQAGPQEMSRPAPVAVSQHA